MAYRYLLRHRAFLEDSYSQSDLIRDHLRLISYRWPEICCNSETIALLHLANWRLSQSAGCYPIPNAFVVNA